VARALKRSFFRVDSAPDMSVQKIVGARGCFEVALKMESKGKAKE